MADLIELLVVNGMKLDELLIVGHSLGAHISGCAAKLLTSGKPGIIIGLDPAKVDYDFYETTKRLSDNDAGYVQVIHTDSDKFGFAEPMGHGNIHRKFLKNDCASNFEHIFQRTFIQIEEKINRDVLSGML